MAFRDKKDEDEGFVNPFVGLEKSSVLQEARAFNEMPINPRKCCLILTKILYLISQGETIATREATETFFAMTKLFQNQDPNLRRMVFLTIKEMANIAEDVIIVTSSLTKDMTGKVDIYRASAIRTLCRITDSTMLAGIERYLKQAIVDRHPGVASAALVSSLHLMKDNLDVVKRWVNEVQQAVNSRSQMVQYHALGLLYHIKQKDRLAIAKLVSKQMHSTSMRSPFAHCLLIRYASKVIEQDPDSDNTELLDFLEGSLRNKSEMVIYEAARAIVNLRNVTPRELAPAVSVLQLFLSSPKPTLRFAGVRTLNKVAMKHPMAIKTCNLDMENLITDSNRSIATLAITTLLKTGSEASVDRLMKQISSFMSEITDEFKIVVVEAIRALCLKFPQKHASMMAFLSNALRDEGGFEFKRAIVDTIVGIVEHVAEAKEAGLAHLCEFIEDCEYPALLTRVLHIIGEQGPRTPVPSKYIRFIYNRLILENSTVRAAAVSALAKFGTVCDSLRPSIIVLLRRCLYDGDDEVRDRATFYLDLLDNGTPAAASKFVVNTLPNSVAGMERALGDYLASPSETPFDVKTVSIEAPVVEKRPAEDEDDLSAGAKAEVTTTRDIYAEQLAQVPQFAGLGPLFKSNKAVELTESETEYVVRCTKHIFPGHLVMQFDLTNTLNDQQLENVKIVLEGGEQEIDEDDVVIVPCPLLQFEKPGVAYVCIPLDPTIPTQTFSARMDFVVKDCDPETGECDEEGYEDTYQLEEVEVTLADFMQGVNKPNFGTAWEELEGAHESEDTFALSTMASIEDAVNQIVSFLGMQACEKTNKVKPEKGSHTLLLAGVYAGGHEVLARARLAFDQEVTLNLTVRSTDENTCQIVAAAVG